MKIVVALVAAVALLASCQPGAKPATATGAVSKTDVGYAFGVIIGTNMKTAGVDVDYDAFLSGVKDVLEKNAPKVAVADAQKTVQNALVAGLAKKAQANLARETKFLADNGKKTGVVTTASGLQYEVLKAGTGPKPQATDTVKVDYVGTLIDGTTFDSSIEKKEPAVFPLSAGVIPGWQEGILLMNVGSKYRLYIPSKLAYGENGTSGKIGPNDTLIFDVDLLSIEPPAKAPAKK
jgi:FKBP-type peptidyl-prolyl cis-trans isomerase FkpA